MGIADTIVNTLVDELTLEPETSYCIAMWGLGLDWRDVCHCYAASIGVGDFGTSRQR